jgi:hypothetical protein
MKKLIDVLKKIWNSTILDIVIKISMIYILIKLIIGDFNILF